MIHVPGPRLLVAGVDEAGRGPLAGPVIAAAVILDEDKPVQGLADSKTLTAERREELSELIRERAVCWTLGRADVEEIDRMNILQATMLAMSRAVASLPRAPGLVKIDGNHAPRLDYPVQTIIRGDVSVPVISAASILAKVARDAEMLELDIRYPGYGFSVHKGYPTRAHIDALLKQGVSPIHRRSFGPVREALAATRSV
jgi:ribonuclease HII